MPFLRPNEQRCVRPPVHAGCDHVVLKRRAPWKRAAQGHGPAVSRQLPLQHPQWSFSRGDNAMPHSTGTIGYHGHPQVTKRFRCSTSSRTSISRRSKIFPNRFAQTPARYHAPDVYHLRILHESLLNLPSRCHSEVLLFGSKAPRTLAMVHSQLPV